LKGRTDSRYRRNDASVFLYAFDLIELIPTAQVLSVAKKRRKGQFEKGNPGSPGRPKGGHDKYTREIKQALLDAVEYVGEETVTTALKELSESERDKAEHDLNTPRGVTAFLVWIAREYPQVACAMLARMMPQQTESTHKVSDAMDRPFMHLTTSYQMRLLP